MNSTANAECVIRGDPDVTGTGIRLSLYILSLAGPLLSGICRSPELALSFDSSLGVTGLALFLTSVVNSARRTMTLFHAICLFHLLALVGISVSPKGRYPMSMIRYLASRWLYYLAACMFLASAIYLFAKAPTYGSQRECNDVVVIVIFGVNVRAASAIFRWIFVAALASFLFVVVIYCVAMCCVFACCRDSRRWVSNDNTTEDDQSKLWSMPKDVSLVYLLGRLGACSYVIGMLELTIRRNQVSSDESLWTFGQVFAMVMLVGPVIEIFSLTLGRLGDDMHR